MVFCLAHRSTRDRRIEDRLQQSCQTVPGGGRRQIGRCRSIALSGVLALTVLFAIAVPGAVRGQTDSVAAFYRGKTVTIQVGYDAGGGFDLTARLVAQHLGKHMPGMPIVVVQNVPGGGSLNVMNAIYNVAAPDGLTLAVFLGTNIMEPLYGNKQAQFRAERFSWIANMDTDLQACGVWMGGGAGIKTMSDLVRSKKVITFGSTAPNAGLSKFPLFFQNVFGAPVKIVNGYRGTKDIELAMKRGEVDGYCGFFESTVRASYMPEVASGEISIFVQLGLDRSSSAFGAATPIRDLLATEEQRRIASIIFGPILLSRPLVGPPLMPRDRIAALRSAFLAAARDPELIAAGSKANIVLRPQGGEEAEALVADLMAVPPEFLKKAYDYTHAP